MNVAKLYEKLPVLFQNAAVSVYGIKREWSRYCGKFNKYLKIFLTSDKADNDFIRNYQAKELRALFIEADKSRHYSAVFRELNINVRKDDPYEILKKMPVLSKDELRGYEEEFRTEQRMTDLNSHTSGSTGSPLNIYSRLDDFRARMALLERQKLRFGISHKSKHISFVGKKITRQAGKSFWRYNIFGHQLVMSVYDLHENNKGKYLQKIIKYNPLMVEGYPSALTVIAKWLSEDDVKLRVKCVLVTAETLTSNQREMIEKGFGCPVVNYYGSTEGAPLITQCECGMNHIDFESGIIEFVGIDGACAEEGKPAKMIVTSFLTKGTPLIRYDIGDLAILSRRKCECGRNTPVILSIIGRMDDVFHTPQKGYIGRLSTTLKLLPSTVGKAQIQQHSDTYFRVVLETTIKLTAEQEELLRRDLHSKLGDIKVNIEYTDNIPSGPNGKFRSQINLTNKGSCHEHIV